MVTKKIKELDEKIDVGRTVYFTRVELLKLSEECKRLKLTLSGYVRKAVLKVLK